MKAGPVIVSIFMLIPTAALASAPVDLQTEADGYIAVVVSVPQDSAIDMMISLSTSSGVIHDGSAEVWVEQEHDGNFVPVGSASVAHAEHHGATQIRVDGSSAMSASTPASIQRSSVDRDSVVLHVHYIHLPASTQRFVFVGGAHADGPTSLQVALDLPTGASVLGTTRGPAFFATTTKDFHAAVISNAFTQLGPTSVRVKGNYSFGTSGPTFYSVIPWFSRCECKLTGPNDESSVTDASGWGQLQASFVSNGPAGTRSLDVLVEQSGGPDASQLSLPNPDGQPDFGTTVLGAGIVPP